MTVASSPQDNGERKDNNIDVPLVFVPGMKGSHLAFESEEIAKKDDIIDYALEQILMLSPFSKNKVMSSKEKVKDNLSDFLRDRISRRQRVWLTLSNLLNLPPKPDNHPDSDLTLPLEYDCTKTDGETMDPTSFRQHRGPLVSDGAINHIIDFFDGNLKFLPFYGHISDYLENLSSPNNSNSDITRPTAVFDYDWRREPFELSDSLHEFIEKKFPSEEYPVVQLCGHSLGGLLAYRCILKYPYRYKPGAVIVGVPFGTGIQYLQDMHRGYFTELDRCRQFLPVTQFSFSSHWIFFPFQEDIGDSFVDVTEEANSSVNNTDTSSESEIYEFQADRGNIGKPLTEFQSEPRKGKPISIDFYNVKSWESHELGIFNRKHESMIDSDTLTKYKRHMEIQLDIARKWREEVIMAPNKNSREIQQPPLVVCATDTVPTVNQILRRKSKETSTSQTTVTDTEQNNEVWEYDYMSGRSVPGDGRIDFDKAFPDTGFNNKEEQQHRIQYKTIRLNSLHAKQMCWEDYGGNLQTILNAVQNQIDEYNNKQQEDKSK